MIQFTPERVKEQLERFVASYRDEPDSTVPERVAAHVMARMIGLWGMVPFNLKLMGEDMHRLIQVLQAFHGQIACFDAMANPPEEDE
jgi:hypothetical protein